MNGFDKQSQPGDPGMHTAEEEEEDHGFQMNADFYAMLI